MDFVHVFVDFLCVFVDFWDLGGYPDICIYHIGAPHGTNDPFLCLLFWDRLIYIYIYILHDEQKPTGADRGLKSPFTVVC